MVSGLNKLSPNELNFLDQWIEGYSMQIAKSNQNAFSFSNQAAQSGVIESQIKGAFEGFDSEKVFNLVNGQIWQQSSDEYDYRNAYMPNVTIYKSGSGFKMIVDGVNKTISVIRLK